MAKVKPIPEGYHSLQPYLMFKDCAKAIRFYEAAFGAKEKLRVPGADGRIHHAELVIGDSVLMMADEAPALEAMGIEHYGGSPVSFSLYVENCDAVYRTAVRAGGESLAEPADQFYGDRRAGIKDPFGYKWWVATHIKEVDLATLAEGAQATT